ncbi:MAG: FMN-binding protein [Pseudomonadota bacterium]
MSGVLRLALIALGCGLLVAGVRLVTADPIARVRSAELRASLAALVGPVRADTVRLPVRWPLELCGGQTLLRARARGYGGPIELLVALDAEPRVLSLRVNRHAETPGIGDFIAVRDSDPTWLERFVGSTRDTLAARPFDLDAVAGATITVRGVRNALSAALEREVGFDPTPCPPSSADSVPGAAS